MDKIVETSLQANPSEMPKPKNAASVAKEETAQLVALSLDQLQQIGGGGVILEF